VVSDLALARRLERAEGSANARFVEARAVHAPETGACWMEVAGAYAMFDGPHSPCTQTFGLGLDRMPTPEEMTQLEAFFRDRGASTFHEVSPMADAALLPLLHQRGYRPVELTSVLYLPLAGRRCPESGEVTARLAGADEVERFADIAAEGWREHPEFSGQIRDLMTVMAKRKGALNFLAELDGKAIGAGALAVHEGIALLAGASTIPEWRRRGAQRALLATRLDYAAQSGCDLAMICAAPGSESQRNAERAGFRIAYTRIKWCL
jgi:GNAT superfamily N-acetyltransferase